MPRTSSPTFASLFCGCGGFDLGFQQAGFRCISAFDLDPIAVAAHTLNLKSPAAVKDVDLGIADEVSHADVILAGPPCQGFSLAGKRKTTDPRNKLMPLAAQIAVKARPKVFLLENVAGAQSGSHSRYWSRLKKIMEAADYKTTEFSLVGSNCGVPQMRKRSMFLAWRTPGTWPDEIEIAPGGTLSDALNGVEGLPNHVPSSIDSGSRLYSIALRIGSGQKLSNVRGGERSVHTWHIPEVFGEVSEEEKEVLVKVLRLRRTHRVRERGDADPVPLSLLCGRVERAPRRVVNSLVKKGYLKLTGVTVDLTHTFNGKFRRLELDKPSYTVDTRFGDPRYFLHPNEQRGFTIREAARIQGFPDTFIFSDDSKANFRLIGNAVPPPMGMLIGTLIRKHLLK
jgi:DNA (cytosine-5)-methyltransferase 1